MRFWFNLFSLTWQFFCYLSKCICPLLTWLRVLFPRLNAANITQKPRVFLGRLPDLLYTLLKPKQNHPNRQMKLRGKTTPWGKRIFFSEQPFYGNYSTLDSHSITVIFHAFAYSSRWRRKPWQGLLISTGWRVLVYHFILSKILHFSSYFLKARVALRGGIAEKQLSCFSFCNS